MAEAMRLQSLLADYPNTLALKAGQVQSPLVNFDFAPVKLASEGFKPMVREQKFDFGELAIVTYLQAKSFGKPYVLLPAVVMGRGQHHTIAYNAERGELKPGDLTGKRVGIRAYSVTTGVWVRGILQHDHGVDLSRVTWVTVEDPHVAEFKDPPNVQRAPAGKTMLDMLLAGELDAAVLGDNLPKDPRIKHLIPNPHEAARDWSKRHGSPAINHLIVVRQSLSQSRPDVVKEIYRLLRESKQAGPAPTPDEIDPLVFGVENMRKALEIVIGYSFEQGVIPRRFTVDELFDDVTRSLN
jgi:4,5-dihydroxyphthalate decarboxylase